MACDICGKTGTPLNELLSIYRTEEIASVCNDCESTINRHLWKVQGMVGKLQRDLMKRFFRYLKTGKKEPVSATQEGELP